MLGTPGRGSQATHTAPAHGRRVSTRAPCVPCGQGDARGCGPRGGKGVCAQGLVPHLDDVWPRLAWPPAVANRHASASHVGGGTQGAVCERGDAARPVHRESAHGAENPSLPHGMWRSGGAARPGRVDHPCIAPAERRPRLRTRGRHDLSRPAAPGSNLPHATFRECGYTLGGASTARLDVGRADADDRHAVRRKAPRFYLARANCQGSLRRHAEGNARGALGPGRLGRLRRGAAALKRVVPAAWRSHPIRLGVVAAAYEVAPRGRARSFAGMRKTVLAQGDRLPTV